MPMSDRQHWTTTWSVPVLATAVYLGTLSRNLSISHDAIEHLNAVESGWSFHPNHLLHEVCARAWLLAWRSIGWQADSAVVVSTLSALCGGVALLALGHLLRSRLGLPPLTTAAACALCGGTFAMGYNASSVAVYALPLPAALLALALMSGDRWDSRRAVAAGACCAVAVLLHQMYGLLAVALAVRGVMEARRGPRGAAIPLVAGLAATAVGVVVPYVVVGLTLHGAANPADAVHWMLGHASRADYWGWPSPGRAAIGLGRAWIGGHFALAIPAVAQVADEHLAAHYLVDEHYLVRGTSPALAFALLAVTATAALAMVGLLVRGARRIGRAWTARSSAWLPLLTWTIVSGAFFLCWMPELPEFWLFACIASSAALGAAATPSDPQRRCHASLILLVLIALSVWSVNLLGSFRFARDPARDYYAARIAPLCDRADAGDLVVTGRCWMQQAYLRRCCPAEVLCQVEQADATQPIDRDHVRRAVDGTLDSGGTVFWLADAITPEPAAAIRHGSSLLALTEAWEPYRDWWLTLEGGPEPIYALQSADSEPARPR